MYNRWSAYFHGCSVIIHATIENVDHSIIELVFPAHLNHLKNRHKLLNDSCFVGSLVEAIETVGSTAPHAPVVYPGW